MVPNGLSISDAKQLPGRTSLQALTPTTPFPILPTPWVQGHRQAREGSRVPQAHLYPCCYLLADEGLLPPNLKAVLKPPEM